MKPGCWHQSLSGFLCFKKADLFLPLLLNCLLFFTLLLSMCRSSSVNVVRSLSITAFVCPLALELESPAGWLADKKLFIENPPNNCRSSKRTHSSSADELHREREEEDDEGEGGRGESLPCALFRKNLFPEMKT